MGPVRAFGWFEDFDEVGGRSASFANLVGKVASRKESGMVSQGPVPGHRPRRAPGLPDLGHFALRPDYSLEPFPGRRVCHSPQPAISSPADRPPALTSKNQAGVPADSPTTGNPPCSPAGIGPDADDQAFHRQRLAFRPTVTRTSLLH